MKLRIHEGWGVWLYALIPLWIAIQYCWFKALPNSDVYRAFLCGMTMQIWVFIGLQHNGDSKFDMDNINFDEPIRPCELYCHWRQYWPPCGNNRCGIWQQWAGVDTRDSNINNNYDRIRHGKLGHCQKIKEAIECIGSRYNMVWYNPILPTVWQRQR